VNAELSSEVRGMGDALRRPGEPDIPNMNVVPPSAPLGSADPATTVGRTRRETSRGAMNANGLVENRLEGSSEALLLEDNYDARGYDGAARGIGSLLGNAVHRGLHVVGGSSGDLRERASALADDLRAHAEEWKDRAGDLANDISVRVSDLTDKARRRGGELADNARLRADALRRDVAFRTRDIRERGGRYVDERPLQALGIVAGIGFLLGVGLCLAKPHRRLRREY